MGYFMIVDKRTRAAVTNLPTRITLALPHYRFTDIPCASIFESLSRDG